MFTGNKNQFYSESSNIKLNNNINEYNDNRTGLKKLNEEVINKDSNNNDIDIDKIEERLSQMTKQEFFIRENQISRPVDEIIEVPKKKIKDEVKILSEDKLSNIKKNQIRKIEKEKDNIKRKMEMEINSKKIKRYNDKVNIYKLKIRKKSLKNYCKLVALIIVITGLVIVLIILLDKYL